MKKYTQLVSNKIMTPDGTIIQSFHVHDYVVHNDKNGKQYMVDGGLEYLRRTVHSDAPYTELSLYIEDHFEDIRKEFHWGTRGKDGKQPLTWKALMHLDTDHIKNILETQTNIKQWVCDLFEQELQFRGIK
mgnify:CR=1 FL=1|jgi:hypothetical protein